MTEFQAIDPVLLANVGGGSAALGALMRQQAGKLPSQPAGRAPQPAGRAPSKSLRFNRIKDFDGQSWPLNEPGVPIGYHDPFPMWR